MSIFVFSSRNILLFLEIIQYRDSLSIKRYYRDDLALWEAMGSHKYVKVLVDTQHIMYKRFNYQDLSTYQNNVYVRLKEDSNAFKKVKCLAKDGLCEYQVNREN